MWIHPSLWEIDPLPMPPTSDVTSMRFWRWWSRETLRRRL